MQHPPWPTYPHKHPYRRRHVLVAVFKSIYARFGIFSGIKQHNMLGRSCCEGAFSSSESEKCRWQIFLVFGWRLPSTIHHQHHAPYSTANGWRGKVRGTDMPQTLQNLWAPREKKKIKPKWRGMRCLAGGAMLARNLNDMPYMYILVYIWDGS